MPPTVTMSGAGVIGAAHRMVLRRPPIAARGGVPGRGVQKVAEVQVQVGDRAEIRGEHVWLEGVGAITENDRSGVVRTHAGVLTSVTLGGSVGVGPRRGAIAGQRCAREAVPQSILWSSADSPAGPTDGVAGAKGPHGERGRRVERSERAR